MNNIFQKVRDAIAANINEAVDNNARPDIMARYYADKAENEVDILLTRAAEASVDRKNCEDDIKRTKEDIATLQEYAVKAANAGNEDDARKCLIEKKRAEAKLDALNNALDILKQNEETVIAEYQNQANELATMRAQETSVRATVTLTETKRQKGSRGMQLFRRAKANAERALEIENNKIAIGTNPTSAVPVGITQKYDNNIEAELAALMKG